MSSSRKRQPNPVVVKGLLGKYKKKKEEEIQKELGSSVKNLLTSNNLNSVYDNYNQVTDKLREITKATTLTEKAKIWSDLQVLIGKKAYSIQKELGNPNRWKHLFMSVEESEHADFLMATCCYITRFATEDIFPELKIENDKRIQKLQDAYIKLDEEIKQGKKVSSETKSESKVEENTLSKEEIAKLNAKKDEIIVELACFGVIENIANDEAKRAVLYPGFNIPKDSDKESRNATVTYKLQPNVPTALQKYFFEFLTERQDFETAEKIYIVPFCEENNLSVDMVMNAGNLVVEAVKVNAGTQTQRFFHNNNATTIPQPVTPTEYDADEIIRMENSM